MFCAVTIAVLLLLRPSWSLTMCPKECSCPLNERGHWQVLCLKGGLSDPLPVLEMPSSSEILIVTAPEGETNTLTLGPIFRGLPNLEEVHVVHSKVPALGEHSFWGLRKLRLLNISHNSINALLPANFRGPDALQQLDLSHNNIESSPSAVFRYVKRLKFLDLSHNRMPELVPRIFFGLSELQKLDLSHNPLGDLPHSRFSDLPSLTELKCEGCGLLTISQSLFKELQQLNSLDLSNNRLLKIPPLGLAKHLRQLRINGNHIAKMHMEDLKGVPLQDLYISHNRLSAIEEGSFKNASLKILDVSYNRISVLDSKVLEPILAGLKFVDFSGNSLHIEQLKNILPKTRQLRELGIGDLGLTRLPSDLLRRSRHLRYLNISSNYLSRFPHQLLYSTPHLQTLDLSGNSFRGLEQNVVSAFRAMPSLTSVHLEKNPWQCEECHISFLISWLKLSTKQPHSLKSCKETESSIACLKCVGPANIAGQRMVLLNEENLEDCSSASQSLWPSWEAENDIVLSDEPRSSINKRGNVDDKDHFETVAAFFKDHIALLVGVGCGLVLAMMLVIVTALACSRRQSAYYYTSEGEIEKQDKLMGRNNNDSPVSSPTTSEDPSVVPPYEPMAISKVHSRTPICSSKTLAAPITSSLSSKKRPTIATIEEITSLDV